MTTQSLTPATETRADPLAAPVEAMCEAFELSIDLSATEPPDLGAALRKCLLAALPKIEATPGMRTAGYERLQLSSDMDDPHGAEEIWTTMRDALVKESTR